MCTHTFMVRQNSQIKIKRKALHIPDFQCLIHLLVLHQSHKRGHPLWTILHTHSTLHQIFCELPCCKWAYVCIDPWNQPPQFGSAVRREGRGLYYGAGDRSHIVVVVGVDDVIVFDAGCRLKCKASRWAWWKRMAEIVRHTGDGDENKLCFGNRLYVGMMRIGCGHGWRLRVRSGLYVDVRDSKSHLDNTQ